VVVAEAAARTYQRRTPEATTLYRVVESHLEACLERARERSEHGFGYPAFVESEFRRYLDCGILERGLVRIRCTECPRERLVAFSCKTRGVCPSCTSRRMANTAAHLVDRVLPEVPYRQWVLSLPRRVRFQLACDDELLSAVLALLVRKVHAWQKRQARRQGAHGLLAGGAVTFVQRFGSLLNLNCHFHSLIPDGVYEKVGDDLRFVPVPPPATEDVERILLQIARAIEKLLARRAEVASDETPSFVMTEGAESVGLGRRFEGLSKEHAHNGSAGARASARRSAFVYGYSLHADRRVEAEDREGLERLCRYGSRAPVSNARLSLSSRGEVVLALRRPLFDGRTELRFSPLDFLRRLATLIPPPRKHLTRYHGVFAPNHSWRDQVVPAGARPHVEEEAAEEQKAPDPRIPWAELLRRVFAIDVLQCDVCQSPMRILAFITDPEVAETVARYWKSRAPPRPRVASLPPEVRAGQSVGRATRPTRRASCVRRGKVPNETESKTTKTAS
jgi:hypothetical protein